MCANCRANGCWRHDGHPCRRHPAALRHPVSSGLELQDSRVDRLEIVDGIATVHFPHACIHRSRGRPGRGAGSLWSQEARLLLWSARLLAPAQGVTGTVAEGYVEVGGVRHDILPLPFSRRTTARVFLRVQGGGAIHLEGERPLVELHGSAMFLERYW